MLEGNRNRISLSKATICFSMLLLLAAAVSGGEPGPRHERNILPDILPPETLFYLQMAFPREGAERPKTSLAAIAQDAEMSAFLGDIDRAMARFIQEVAAETLVRADGEAKKVDADDRLLLEGWQQEVSNVIQAPKSFALLDVSEDGKAIYLLAAIAQKPLAQRRFYESLQVLAEQHWKRLKQETADPLLRMIPLKNIAQEESYPGGHVGMRLITDPTKDDIPPLRIIILEQTLLFFHGPRSEPLQEMLKRYDARLESRTLARDERFRRVRQGVGYAPGDFFAYLNLDLLNQKMEVLRDPRYHPLLESLGLLSAKALGCGGSEWEEGVRHVFYLYAPGERQGLLRSLLPQEKAAAELAATELPGAAAGILAAQVDLKILHAEMPRFIEVSEKVLGLRKATGLAGLAARPTFFGVPAEKIIDTLGDTVIIECGPSGTALRFARADAGAFEKVMARIEQDLMRLRGQKFAASEIAAADGSRILVRYFNRSGDPVPLAPAYCIRKRYADGTAVIYAATHPQVIKAILRQPAEQRLSEAEDYQRVMRGLGSGYHGFLYLDNRESHVRVYDALLPATNLITAKPEVVSNLPAVVRFLRPYFGGAVDPGKLPAGSAIARHFFGTGVGVRNNPEGVTCVVYGPLGLGGILASLFDKLVISDPKTIGTIAAAVAYKLTGGDPDAFLAPEVPGEKHPPVKIPDIGDK